MNNSKDLEAILAQFLKMESKFETNEWHVDFVFVAVSSIALLCRKGGIGAISKILKSYNHFGTPNA